MTNRSTDETPANVASLHHGPADSSQRAVAFSGEGAPTSRDGVLR